jgi:hypothetical protein
MIFTTWVIISSSTFLILKFELFWTNSVTIMKLTIAISCSKAPKFYNVVSQTSFFEIKTAFYTLFRYETSRVRLRHFEFFFTKELFCLLNQGLSFIKKCWILKFSNFKIQHFILYLEFRNLIVSKLALPIWKYVTLWNH